MNPSQTKSRSAAQVLQAPRWVATDSSRAVRWLSDLMLVTKARANVAVVATTFIGFALHADILPNWLLLLHTLLGTALLAGSAAVANQIIEHEFDRKMARTRHRPIAAGRLHCRTATWLCAAFAVTGVLWLGATVNLRAMIFAALAFLIYVFVYTPLKRRTPACILAGAVSGALPLWIGWAAADAGPGLWAAVPFAVLFLWQFPHFLAIAWWRRADYFGAGYRVLDPRDHQGYRTASWSLVSALAVVAVSFVPAIAHRVNGWYWLGAFFFGMMFSVSAIRFLLRRNEAAARSLFLASLYYLPAVYVLMLLCRIKI